MYNLEILLTEEKLQAKVGELARQINQDYAGKELLVVGILRGAFVFMADLVRKLDVSVIIDFVAVSSYGDETASSGVVRILKDLDETITGRHVLLVEDIIDTGLTLKYLYKNLKARRPASLKVCTLLDKPDRRKVDLVPDYNGFIIPDYFVVGYGLDCGQRFRNLRGIYVIHQKSAEETEETQEEDVKGRLVMDERDRSLLWILVVCMHSWLPAVSARLVFTVRLCPILQLWRKLGRRNPEVWCFQGVVQHS